MIPTRIVIVDDHAIFRQGLRKLFDEHPEFCVVGEASNGAEAIEMPNRTEFDVMLLDLQLGDMTGLDVLRRLGSDHKFRVILLGADIQREDEVNAILLGASGIVRKYAASETLFKSIKSVLEGEMWVKRDVMKDLVGIMRGPRSSFGDSSGQFGLTGRELEIVRAVVQGLGNKEISESLGISPFTVKHYLTRIFSKLLVNNRVELVLFATRNRLAENAAARPAAAASQGC
jgi:DNA-binding NarL/FixJ family response regulator